MLAVSCPKVTVLMSVYNGAQFLHESIQGILSQTFADFEFIIIDDGSTDDTKHILQSYATRDSRVRLILNNTNIGLTASLNRGLELARGEYLARQDSDDVSLSQRLQEQVTRLDHDPALILIGSAYHVVDAMGVILGTTRNPESDTAIKWRMLIDNPFAHSSVMFRRQPLLIHGLRYDERCRFAQDYDLWSRLLQYGAGENLSLPLIRYRVHGDNLGERFSAAQEETACRIATSNMIRLGVKVSLAEMRMLREWQNRNIITSFDFVRLYRLMLDALESFSRLHWNAGQEVREIRCQWMVKCLACFPFSRLPNPSYSKIFFETVRLDPLGLLLRFIMLCRGKRICNSDF